MDLRHEPDTVHITKQKQLTTRESDISLVQLGEAGGIDARSEVGCIVNLVELTGSHGIRFHCECTQVKDNERFVPSHVVVTDNYLYILRPTHKGSEHIIKRRRRIDTIMRITKKAKIPDAIKIEYGTPSSSGGAHHEAFITDVDRLHVPRKSDALIKCLKSLRASPEADH